MFLRTIETELCDESVRIKLRAFLRVENIGDEKLLLELNIAACEEAGRQAEFTLKKQVSSKISSVETDSSEFSHNSKKKREQKMIWQPLYSYGKQVLQLCLGQ